MKILPFSFWQNGKYVVAESINCNINFDNLEDHAIFFYSLKDIDENDLTKGVLTIDGKDYENWSTNREAYEFVCNQLGLIIKQ